MILPETLKGRCWYTSTIFTLSLMTKCVSFGSLYTGSESDDIDDAVSIAETTVVEMCKYVNNIILLVKNK